MLKPCSVQHYHLKTFFLCLLLPEKNTGGRESIRPQCVYHLVKNCHIQPEKVEVTMTLASNLDKGDQVFHSVNNFCDGQVLQHIFTNTHDLTHL